MKKKREFQSSELVKSFAKIYGFEDKLLAFEIKDFLQEYLNDALFQEIGDVNLDKKILSIKIKSPLLKNDFRMRKTFFLNKFKEKFGEENISDLQILYSPYRPFPVHEYPNPLRESGRKKEADSSKNT